MSEKKETALSKAIDTIGILIEGQSSLLRIIESMDKRLEKLEDILIVKKDKDQDLSCEIKGCDNDAAYSMGDFEVCKDCYVLSTP